MNVTDAVCQFRVAPKMHFGGCQQVYFPVFTCSRSHLFFGMAFIVRQFVPYICHVRILLEPHVGRHAFDMIGLRGSDQQKVEQQISIIRIVTDNTDYRGTKIIINTTSLPIQFVVPNNLWAVRSVKMTELPSGMTPW